jgi:DtxR family transcriptional regulator, Mn-dependent transcriptional regulator
MYTEATENYLRNIYELQECHTPVTTGALAARLAVRPPSVTNMLKRLAALNLVVYNPYHTVVLTAAGETVARRLLRSHRLIECYLSAVFELPFDQVHEAADEWEHALSPEVCNASTSRSVIPATTLMALLSRTACRKICKRPSSNHKAPCLNTQ